MTTTPARYTASDTELVAAELRQRLPAWLVSRRWFEGKDAALPTVEPLLVEELAAGDATLLLAVVRAGQDAWYQLLLGLRHDPGPLPDELADGRIGACADGRELYEATADPELMGRLLDRLATGEPADAGADAGSHASVRFRRTPGAHIPTGLPAELSTAEQSNTSVAFGGRMMLKVLRHPAPGPNPELELLSALGRVGGVPSAAPLAWIETSADLPGGATTLGILQEFVPNRGDGWALAVAEARACIVGECESVAPLGGFADDAHALGQATVRVHAALASGLGTRELGPPEVEELVGVLQSRLARAVAQVPQLSAFERKLGDIYRELGEVAGRGEPLLAQRAHGDLHLGQVLRADDGWVLIDFEGEPGRPQDERRRMQPAIRDVAAMLRSFDYAAHHALADVLGRPPGEQSPQDLRATRLARRASAWAVHGRRAFCAGYADAGGVNPHGRPVLLRAFEADKAVYEAVYEAHSRPAWLPIPMAAVRRLAGRA
ncbi:maltokinase N-terminal cap-like domain-containing protein [Streptomyces luteolus]|uniref:Maltokinase n=1 Tax=Streptomyces luteolus TaxID=3043615 RepID=A0ABT6SSZ9_9ACTN|nr:maltokinase [Streptomyces sp. B-S-A12]MDI3418490.1 maltokinase [Streptomyces sp. B-S-A12]